jgi:hypothetical protein
MFLWAQESHDPSPLSSFRRTRGATNAAHRIRAEGTLRRPSRGSDLSYGRKE